MLEGGAEYADHQAGDGQEPVVGTEHRGTQPTAAGHIMLLGSVWLV